MKKKSTLSLIFKYAFPNVISMWIFTLYTIIDGIFIGKFVGATALAGVNLVFPLINLIFSISIMIGVGSSTIIAIKFGENKIEEGNKILTSAVFINFIFSIAITTAILIFYNPIIEVLGAKNGTDIYFFTKEYLQHIIPFSIFYMIGYALEIYIKVDGKPSYPAYCVLVGGITNLALDYIFVVKFNWGVKGSAIATGISQIASCSLLIYYIFFKAKIIKFVKVNTFFIKKTFIIFKIGFPEFLTEVSSGILILIYNLVILNKIGVQGISVYSVITYITSFITMTMIGFGQGMQPIISYYLGEKNYKKINDIFKKSLFLLSIIGVFVFLLINFFTVHLGKLFFDENILVLELKKYLSIYSLSYIILGINIFISSYFTALKKPLYSSLITFPRTILFNGILLLVLPIFFGNNSIWTVSFLSEFLTIFICIFLFYKKI